MAGDGQAGKHAPNLLVCAPLFDGSEVKGLKARKMIKHRRPLEGKCGEKGSSLLHLHDIKVFWQNLFGKDLHLNLRKKMDGWMVLRLDGWMEMMYIYAAFSASVGKHHL